MIINAVKEKDADGNGGREHMLPCYHITLEFLQEKGVDGKRRDVGLKVEAATEKGPVTFLLPADCDVVYVMNDEGKNSRAPIRWPLVPSSNGQKVMRTGSKG